MNSALLTTAIHTFNFTSWRKPAFLGKVQWKRGQRRSSFSPKPKASPQTGQRRAPDICCRSPSSSIEIPIHQFHVLNPINMAMIKHNKQTRFCLQMFKDHGGKGECIRQVTKYSKNLSPSMIFSCTSFLGTPNGIIWDSVWAGSIRRMSKQETNGH